jgi:hypothetical protein
MIDRVWLNELAADLGIAPKEATTAITLMRTGRSYLVAAVLAGRMTVREALAAARADGRL